MTKEQEIKIEKDLREQIGSKEGDKIRVLSEYEIFMIISIIRRSLKSEHSKRSLWEQELREKIESLEASTWGNEVEYLAKDDVLALCTEHKGKKRVFMEDPVIGMDHALSGNELENCECHKSGLPSHCGKCIDS